jgi:hypothetical protein
MSDSLITPSQQMLSARRRRHKAPRMRMPSFTKFRPIWPSRLVPCAPARGIRTCTKCERNSCVSGTWIRTAPHTGCPSMPCSKHAAQRTRAICVAAASSRLCSRQLFPVLPPPVALHPVCLRTQPLTHFVAASFLPPIPHKSRPLARRTPNRGVVGSRSSRSSRWHCFLLTCGSARSLGGTSTRREILDPVRPGLSYRSD